MSRIISSPSLRLPRTTSHISRDLCPAQYIRQHSAEHSRRFSTFTASSLSPAASEMRRYEADACLRHRRTLWKATACRSQSEGEERFDFTVCVRSSPDYGNNADLELILREPKIHPVAPLASVADLAWKAVVICGYPRMSGGCGRRRPRRLWVGSTARKFVHRFPGGHGLDDP
ncbi:hypothetical protein FA95DRAFT_1047453 [Auriscalpium vulgare]|uniref:Uncharacterized protein n=1 Tax=Auriscalpium vulgare TaxID=40419 RepID=A0ACB8SAX0_9AGAM|nr:hypothetical protein FA95DRAFT_1047453 [Auriscalpium vulgare]